MTGSYKGLRGRLHRPGFTLGIFSIITSSTVVDLACVAGFDVVIIDMEHSAHSRESVAAALVTASDRATAAVVRVPDRTASTIQAVLDLGADGVLVPQVGSAEHAREVVEAARFAPHGRRGVNPWVRAARYNGGPDWFNEQNASVAVMVMVEGAGVVDELPAILRTPGLDAIFVGPVDLASSLGLAGQPNHPDVVAVVNGIISQADQAGVAVAAFAPDVSRALALRSQGIKFVACDEDTNVLLTAFSSIVSSVTEAGV